MRKLILSMEVSLDGYTEGPNKDASWMMVSDKESWADLFEMLQTVDLMVLGRGMFAEYRDYWKKVLQQPGADANELRYAQVADKTPHRVFSNSMDDPDWHNTQVVKGAAEEEVRRLKQLPGKDIYLVGGVRFATSMINAGLVDEYRIAVVPFMVGGGKSFFHQANARTPLELINSKQLKSGMVILHYRKNASGA